MIVEATNCNRTYAAKAKSLAVGFSSDIIDFKDMPMGSIHVFWRSVTGAFDGEFKIYASNIPDDAAFTDNEIDGAVIVIHNANGSRLWIRDRLAFRYAQVRYVPNGVTAGEVDLVAIGKKS
jgi:hypothetical protein